MVRVRVAFVHPDLGIGGAERLVVDAALALKSRGHNVHMFTAHHDSSHCFKETADGTLDVTCRGDWLPRHICHKGYALWAYVRMVYIALYLVFFSKMKFDVIVCDQVSACVPVLKWSGAKVLFYCHFPDQLLTTRQSWLKALYRRPIDALEEWTTGKAHDVLVNSNFTAEVFHSTFRTLVHVQPTVLYPSLNFAAFDSPPSELENVIPPQSRTVFLSINRYERKKNLPLAIRAFAQLMGNLGEGERPTVHLIMAGEDTRLGRGGGRWWWMLKCLQTCSCVWVARPLSPINAHFNLLPRGRVLPRQIVWSGLVGLPP